MDLNFSDHELERYSRHILLPQVGALGQAAIRSASVLVVGVGGLGAPLAQQLAAAGVGHIGLMDPDHVELGNLQRQILYKTSDVGRLKVEAARDNLSLLNPLVRITVIAEEASERNLDVIVRTYDMVCDGTDNVPTRLAVSDACVRAGRTLVSGAVQGFSGQLAVFRPQSGGPCYRCLFPHPDAENTRNCGEAGVLGPAAGVMGSLMAVAVLREVMGLEGGSGTRLTVWDALCGTLSGFDVPINPECPIHGTGSMQ